MLILTLRTDKPDAEIGLYEHGNQVAYKTWEAHRKLAETIHDEIKDILDGRSLANIEGIIAYKGPGSFTGLRIGISVANTLADSLDVPIVGVEGEDWVTQGISMLSTDQNHKIVLPEYGAPVHITQQKK